MLFKKQNVMKEWVLLCILVCLLTACQSSLNDSAESTNVSSLEDKSDVFYQYSIFGAFINRIYDGILTAKKLKENGDMAEEY